VRVCVGGELLKPGVGVGRYDEEKEGGMHATMLDRRVTHTLSLLSLSLSPPRPPLPISPSLPPLSLSLSLSLSLLSLLLVFALARSWEKLTNTSEWFGTGGVSRRRDAPV